jgi:hypothetical protein
VLPDRGGVSLHEVAPFVPGQILEERRVHSLVAVENEDRKRPV